jgi:hypothetical protein
VHLLVLFTKNLLTGVNEICLTFYVYGPVWINFGTGDAQKKLLSAYHFWENRRNDSLGMYINCYQYLPYFWPDVYEIWSKVFAPSAFEKLSLVKIGLAWHS